MHKLYLDIETTGLSKEDHEITVLGAFDGEEVYQLVKGRDLNNKNVNKLLEKAKKIVTFNGKRFDVPFLEHKYNLDCEFDHKDLMYLGWEIGWKGGLKKIEKKIGMERDSGVTKGSEAIKLWRRYQKEGKGQALKKLLKYNREDVVNLPTVEKEIEERL